MTNLLAEFENFAFQGTLLGNPFNSRHMNFQWHFSDKKQSYFDA
jgi:hypothetical protein